MADSWRDERNSKGEPIYGSAEVKDEELLPFGWAPGFYSIACSKCPGGVGLTDGAKQSWRCRTHALEDLETIRARVRALPPLKPSSAPAAPAVPTQVDGTDDKE
jgi:hypothetical protein